jgi:hypothetical protein
LRRKLSASTGESVAEGATVLLELLGRKALLVLRGLLEPSVRKETKVKLVFKAKSGPKALLVLKVRLVLKALKVELDLRDLKANPAPLVRKASKVLPVQLGLRERRVQRDLWVLWDPRESKVKSVLLDQWVLWERRAQRVKWVLMVALLTKLQWLMALLVQSVHGLTPSKARMESPEPKAQTDELA